MTKILIVDDHRENIEALSQLVPQDKAEIFSALNANDALELLSKHEFGLALLDVQMPVTSGFELAHIVRSVKRFKTLPIIFVTAHPEDSSLIFESYQSGAVDLLFKPLNPNVVRAKIEMFVELARQRDLLQSQVQELERLRFEAEAANTAKSQFLANMSHEIRTPLAAVMGFAEVIALDRGSPSELEECSQAIKRNGGLLMRLIDDILDLSKIEANRLELQKSPFDLDVLLHDVESTMSFRARENGVELEFDFPKEIKYEYISDPERIKQVLLNIIGNAIKFTPEGVVRVEASISPLPFSERGAQKVHQLLISVSDQGIGIKPDQAERLFQPFVQADASTKRQFGGSGLGLYIARQIALTTGGDVKLVSSRQGKGSVFEIDLRLEVATAARSKAAVKKSASKISDVDVFKDLRILAVDDSPDNLMLISHYLEGSGASVTYAESGTDAISATEKSEFDLILMDVQMPGMDGHEATTEIRRRNFKKPIIALTAHALRSEHQRCLQAGCDGVLTKPISRGKLIENLKMHVNGVKRR